jgi:hypothetical protein
MHAITYNYAPRTFDNTWIRNNERGTGHTLRNDDDYLLPHPRVEFLRFYQNRTTFKIALKDHLLNGIVDN